MKNQNNKAKIKYTIKRINGYLQKVTPIVDSSGEVIHHAITPFMVELRLRDIMQIIVGACILAIPVGFTEEVWGLGKNLPLINVFIIGLISFSFISLFVYYNFYRYHLREHIFSYCKRVIAIYVLSLIVVGVLLTLTQICNWGSNYIEAIKIIIIAALPASMSATISDALK